MTKAISYFKNKEIDSRHLARRNYYEPKKTSKRWIFFLILFFLILGSLSYLLIFSPYCRINNLFIEIKDYPTLRYHRQELEEMVWQITNKKFLFFIPQNSLIIFPVKKLAERLREDKRIESYLIKKEAPDVLKVSIKIFEPQAILENFDGKIYLLNEMGGEIVEIKEISSILPVVNNQIAENKKFEAEVSFINRISRNFDFKIEKVEIYQDKGVATTKAITSEGWNIYFEKKENLEEQVNNLFLVLREKIKDRKDLSYIDLRFGKKIFYK